MEGPVSGTRQQCWSKRMHDFFQQPSDFARTRIVLRSHDRVDVAMYFTDDALKQLVNNIKTSPFQTTQTLADILEHLGNEIESVGQTNSGDWVQEIRDDVHWLLDSQVNKQLGDFTECVEKVCKSAKERSFPPGNGTNEYKTYPEMAKVLRSQWETVSNKLERLARMVLNPGGRPIDLSKWLPGIIPAPSLREMVLRNYLDRRSQTIIRAMKRAQESSDDFRDIPECKTSLKRSTSRC